MTKFMLVALIGLVATCALLTSAARAQPAATAEGDIPIAEEFWGGPPPQCTSVTVDLEPLPGDLGNATQPEPGWSGPCEMHLSEVGAVIDGHGDRMTREAACQIALHEEGHLHGFGHSEDPSSIMYGGGGLPREAICAEETEAQERAHQQWEMVREWRAGCKRERGRGREDCWTNLRHFADHLRAKLASRRS